MGKIDIEKKRILCVEDNEDTQEMLEVCLHDYALHFARNSAHGLLLAKRGYFDLYILDNWLPDKSGIELCHRIRKFDPHTPIIFYSAAAYPLDQQNGLSAGAQAYLTKPVEPEKLRKTIERLILDAQEKAIQAQQAELAAMRDELHIACPGFGRLMEAKEKGLRAKEKNLRFKAKLAFLAAGGTRGDFARLWPAVYRDKVRASRNRNEL